MSDSIQIGKIPAGARVLRNAGITELAEGSTRMIFYEMPDGSQHWLHSDGHTETTLKIVGPS